MVNKGEVTLKDVYNLIGEIRQEMRDLYVTKIEFDPVRNIVFGMVGFILVTVVSALLFLVVRTGTLAK